MSNRRWAAKVDNNQKSIVDALIKIPGVSVAPNHDDILVGYMGQTFWYEIKSPDSASKDGVVFESAKKDSQKELEKHWSGHYRIVCSLDQILEDINIVEV